MFFSNETENMNNVLKVAYMCNLLSDDSIYDKAKQKNKYSIYSIESE